MMDWEKVNSTVNAPLIGVETIAKVSMIISIGKMSIRCKFKEHIYIPSFETQVVQFACLCEMLVSKF